MNIPISSIIVTPDRQRREISGVSELAESIAELGLINPITVDSSYRLLAGERRLLACKSLGWTEIPARIVEQADERTMVAIELAENVFREGLTWQEECFAALRLYEHLGGSAADTAKFLGFSVSWIHRRVSVARALQQKDPQVMAAGGVRPASNILERRLQRQVDAEIDSIGEVVQEIGPAKPVEEPKPAAEAPIPIFVEDFLRWAPTYTGKKFNFLHVDFPYGVNIDKSDQMQHETHNVYSDTPELFWKLCETLRDNLSRLVYPSCHMMFWYSMKYHREVLDFWQKTDFEVNPIPLVWLKSDNAGILADPNRGPRNIYEVALMMSLGDRKIVKPVSNAYSAPTATKHLHFTEKPKPVLKHFFQMFVDPLTEMLDPTCGSASALRAAEEMGASRILGLDISQENVNNATLALKRERSLRAVSA